MPGARETTGSAHASVLSGSRRIGAAWPGLAVEYAWLPPFEGASHTRPNRIEVVFSAHSGVAIEQGRVVHEVNVEPGALYVVGAQATTLLRVSESSDTLEIYPDMALFRSAAERGNVRHFELEPTLHGPGAVMFARDPVALGVAHILRRACMNGMTLSDVAASSLAHLLVQRVLAIQCHVGPFPSKAAARLGERPMRAVVDYVEEHLTDRITLDDLAAIAHVSPFHFARCFRNSTGLPPHQYVLARRIELAKRRLLTTDLPVREIAWSVGFENISHFRRQFAAHFGSAPGALRAAVARRLPPRSLSQETGPASARPCARVSSAPADMPPCATPQSTPGSTG